MNDLIFTTESQSPAHQLEYWAEVVCKNHAFINIRDWNREPEKPGFVARLISHPLNNVLLSSALADTHKVSHSKTNIGDSNEQCFLLHLQYRGQSLHCHAGHEMTMNEGDFTVADSTRPYDIDLSHHNEMLLMKIPAPLMTSILPEVEDHVGKKIDGTHGIGAIASQAVTNLWKYREQLESSTETRIVHTVIEQLALSINHQNPADWPNPTMGEHHIRGIKHYINAHLSDPNLSAVSIAKANKISVRYLHYLFSQQQQSLAKTILDQRLQQCAQFLRRASDRSNSITELAHHWGFRDSSHFSHKFKQRFGISPRKYRQQFQ